jgi:hypothetical protein
MGESDSLGAAAIFGDANWASVAPDSSHNSSPDEQYQSNDGAMKGGSIQRSLNAIGG